MHMHIRTRAFARMKVPRGSSTTMTPAISWPTTEYTPFSTLMWRTRVTRCWSWRIRCCRDRLAPWFACLSSLFPLPFSCGLHAVWFPVPLAHLQTLSRQQVTVTSKARGSHRARTDALVIGLPAYLHVISRSVSACRSPCLFLLAGSSPGEAQYQRGRFRYYRQRDGDHAPDPAHQSR